MSKLDDLVKKTKPKTHSDIPVMRSATARIVPVNEKVANTMEDLVEQISDFSFTYTRGAQYKGKKAKAPMHVEKNGKFFFKPVYNKQAFLENVYELDSKADLLAFYRAVIDDLRAGIHNDVLAEMEKTAKAEAAKRVGSKAKKS